LCDLTGELIQTLSFTLHKRGISASWCFALDSRIILTNEATDSLSTGGGGQWCFLLLPQRQSKGWRAAVLHCAAL